MLFILCVCFIGYNIVFCSTARCFPFELCLSLGSFFSVFFFVMFWLPNVIGNYNGFIGHWIHKSQQKARERETVPIFITNESQSWESFISSCYCLLFVSLIFLSMQNPISTPNQMSCLWPNDNVHVLVFISFALSHFIVI